MYKTADGSNSISAQRSARCIVLALVIVCSVFICGASSGRQSDPQAQKEYEILNDRSATLISQGHYKDALDMAQRAIDLNPQYSFAWNNKSVALIGLRKFPEALVAADRALEINPLNAVAWTNKALVYRQTNRLDDALQAMDRAALIDANNPLIWYNKACYQALKKDRVGALKSISRALELEPKLKSLVAKESDFADLKEDPEFKQLVQN